MPEWTILIRDHHPCYISWEEFEQNQRMISENAYMQKRADRKSAGGGRVLLAGLVRCGRCGRMMRVFYGSRAGHAHRYQCRGNTDTAGGKMCLGPEESAWIEQSRVRFWKQYRRMPWRRRWLPRNGARQPTMMSGSLWSRNWKQPGTKRPWRHAVTSWWIQQSD
jgi:hypothetical protein